jgi:hypothetical protein
MNEREKTGESEMPKASGIRAGGRGGGGKA